MPGTIEHPPSAPSEAANRNHGHVQQQLVERYLQRTGNSVETGTQEWIVGKEYADKYRTIVKNNSDLQRRLLSAEGADYESVLDEIETLLYGEDA